MKRALVTGGSEGLGRAMVERLIQLGYAVVSVDRAQPPPGAIGILCDLSRRDDIDATMPVIVSGGPYEVVVLNAGVSATGRFEAIPFDAYRQLMTVNAETPMLLAAALMRAGAATRCMTFVSSLSHYTGYPGAAVYAASKDAVAVYARSVRKPFARHGVSVTLACPGPLRTEHAARHAPPGADAARRTDPGHAARKILDATFAGRRLVAPGLRARLAVLAGTLFPAAAIRGMRALIFERLDREIW